MMMVPVLVMVVVVQAPTPLRQLFRRTLDWTGGRGGSISGSLPARKEDLMRKVIYLMNLSLDGFVEGPDGKFDWSVPDEEVHRFHNEQAREMGAFLYGRRMYQIMLGWQTADEDPSSSDVAVDFARIWKATPKVVFSTTLDTVGPNARLVRGEVVAEVTSLKQQGGRDLAVAGPGLAASLARHGLVDEYRLVISPVVVGGGKPYFPPLDQPVPLRLAETRTFHNGAVYLRYLRA
jgi:dihydrofolate reductase